MSSIIEKLGGFAAEVRLNPHSGSIAWVLHRISGLILLLYLILHLWGLGSAAGGKAAFDNQMRAFEGPFFELLEALVVLIAAFHMFNGLRIIAVDLSGLGRHQKALFSAVLGCFALVLAWTGWVFFARVLG